MLTLSNQTSSINKTNIVNPPSNDLNWYPFSPGQCPPTYYIIVQGVCAPLIIIISTLLNSLIAVVLLQKQLRSPTNVLLLAIALYDTLTGLFPFPTYIYMFTFRRCDDYAPYTYALFHRINYEVVPFIFHTCSIWVTLVLAIQRYIYVCHSHKARRWCTIPTAFKAIACINILAIIIAVPMFVEGTFYRKTVRSLKYSEKIFDACVVLDYSKDSRYINLYSFYSVLRAVLINVGPCTLLVILNAILIQRMKEAKKNRDNLMKKRIHENRAQEHISVTLMLIIVVTIFLIVEIPMALHLIIFGLLRLFKPNFTSDFYSFSTHLLNFGVLLSYPINFFIYCRMSRAFREAFTKLLCPYLNRSTQDQLPSVATPSITKGFNNHDNDQNYNNANIEMKNSVIRVEPPPTVILNKTTSEISDLLTSSTVPHRMDNNTKRISFDPLEEHRLFVRADDSTPNDL